MGPVGRAATVLPHQFDLPHQTYQTYPTYLPYPPTSPSCMAPFAPIAKAATKNAIRIPEK